MESWAGGLGVVCPRDPAPQGLPLTFRHPQRSLLTFSPRRWDLLAGVGAPGPASRLPPTCIHLPGLPWGRLAWASLRRTCTQLCTRHPSQLPGPHFFPREAVGPGRWALGTWRGPGRDTGPRGQGPPTWAHSACTRRGALGLHLLGALGGGPTGTQAWPLHPWLAVCGLGQLPVPGCAEPGQPARQERGSSPLPDSASLASVSPRGLSNHQWLQGPHRGQAHQLPPGAPASWRDSDEAARRPACPAQRPAEGG